MSFKSQILSGLEAIKKTFHYQKAEESRSTLSNILDVPRIGSKLFSSTAEVVKSVSSNPEFGKDYSKKPLYLLADKKVEFWDEKNIVLWLSSLDDPFPEDDSDESSSSDPITNIKLEAQINATTSADSSPANPNTILLESTQFGAISSSPVTNILPSAAEAKENVGQMVFLKKKQRKTLKDKFGEMIYANDINGTVLLSLDDSALIELGISDVQKRTLLLKHISKLKTTGSLFYFFLFAFSQKNFSKKFPKKKNCHCRVCY